MVAPLHRAEETALMEIHPCSALSLQPVVAVADITHLMDDQAVLAVEQETTPPQEDQRNPGKETQEVLQVVDFLQEQVAAAALAVVDKQDLAAALEDRDRPGPETAAPMQAVAVVAVDHVPVMEEQAAQVAGHRAADLTSVNLLLHHQTILGAELAESLANLAAELQEVAGRVSSS